MSQLFERHKLNQSCYLPSWNFSTWVRNCIFNACVKIEEQHRGRLQIQGSDMKPDLSYSWTQSEPMTKAKALIELKRLKDKLTSSQLKNRTQAFVCAENFIKNTLHTVPPDIKNHAIIKISLKASKILG